jgi:TolB protein
VFWTVNTESGQADRFNETFGEQRNPRVCGSERFIVFTSIQKGNSKIWRSDIDGKNARPLTSGTSTDGGPSCTPDSKWVIFNSDRSGLTTLWRAPTSGGPPEQLTTDISYFPEVSPDGKLVASVFTDTGTGKESVAVLPITGGRPLWRAKGLSAASPFGWGPDKDRLTFVRQVGEGENLFSLRIGASSEDQLTHFDDEQIFSFSWATEPSRLAFVRGLIATDVVMLPAATTSNKGE